ncbi:cell division control protein 6 homolog [Aplysia californica]|uniref:Cell division control protein n=1 Tax=Aplysia californica TaxID=6500 RepID=A0ABM0ZV18_APLCA|nr:cell division control protein 6 homolog [Aplysia californica]
MASLKSSFSVRKSSRMNLRKCSSVEAKKADPDEKCPEKSSRKDGVRKSFGKAHSVVQALRNVFHGKDKQAETLSPCSDEQSPANCERVCGAGPGDAEASVNLLHSPSSCSSFTASPSKRTPPSQRACASPRELNQARRRLLSPTKRKSDEDAENCLSDSPSPRKSPRSSNDPASQYPLPDDSEDPETPKSSKRSTVRLSRIANSTPRRLFSSPEKSGGNDVSEVSPQKSAASRLFQSPPKSPSRRLFQSPPKSPVRSSPLQKSNARMYQTTKRCLHTAKPARLVGREKEEEKVEEFISERVDAGTSGSLYVSGAPGTGKTAVVQHVVDKLKNEYGNLETAYVNCMTLKDSNGVFGKLYEQLTGKTYKGKDSVKAVEKVFATTGSVVLVLDEIDQLDSKHHHVLYRIFEWPALDKSRLILIGVANALDLTDRVLPRLQASEKCCPDLMNFAPYTSAQITDILKSRLERSLLVEPSAIKFCARKVSAVAGDARKALDVCRRAVEMVEADVRSQQVLKPADCNSPSKKSQEPPVKKVTLVHISKVMGDVYGSSVAAASSSENDVPLQQKIAVCSLLLLVKTGRLKEVLLGRLHEAYTKVCRGRHMAPVDQTEFLSVCLLLEARGVVTLKRAKDTRMIRVSLKLDENELEQTLKDKTLMSQILKDGVV